MLPFIIWIYLFTQGFPVILVCMVFLWIMAWAHTVPVSCQQRDCEGEQSLTTGSGDISPQTNNIFDQNHTMNIIHLIEQIGYHWLSCQFGMWLNMYLCMRSVWSTSCGVSSGFSVDQEMMTNYLHHWFLNKWKKNGAASFSRGTLWVIL